MRILQWIFPFASSRGGRENFVLNLAADQSRVGDEVVVLGLDPADDQPTLRKSQLDGSQIQVIGLGTMLSAREGVMAQLVGELERLFDELRPDVIHNHNPEGPDLLLLRALAKKFDVPVVTTIHGPLLSPSAAAQGKIRLMRELSTRVVAISESSRAETVKNYPDLEGRLDLVVNGVPDFSSPPATAKASNRIFASGRFSPEKGFAQLLAAVAMVQQVIPDVELVLAGAGPDEQILPKYAEVLGLAGRVRFTGWLERAEVAAELAEASVVVVPSVWDEPFGLVAVEAMLAEKPVIATNRGELANIVEHEQTGLLFSSGDVIDLAAKIRMLLENSARAKDFGEAGRLRALERYSQRRCTLQYRSIYLAAQGKTANFSAVEIAGIGAGGDWRVFPQDLGVVLQDADRLADVVAFKASSPVPTIFKMTHDDTTPLPTEVAADAVVFRTSMIAGQPYRNEYPLPILLNGRKFADWEPAPYNELATIGFVGHAEVGSYHRAISQRGEAEVNHVGYQLVETTNTLLRTPVNIGLILRNKAMTNLSNSDQVATDFVTRSRYHHHSDEQALAKSREEFLDGLRKNPYSLCIRGVGNYSIRLYETMAAGRIPVILNSALMLPLDHLIDWKRLGVWVELDQLDQMDALLADFHSSMSPSDLRDKQVEVRETWLRFLSPGTFWKHATAFLNERGIA